MERCTPFRFTLDRELRAVSLRDPSGDREAETIAFDQAA